MRQTTVQIGDTVGKILDGALEDAEILHFFASEDLEALSPQNLADAAMQLRARMLTVDLPGSPIDTCGTGGSGKDRFNVGTLVAFIVAAAGGRVAKHGNRGAGGRCGSFDLLEALGARIDLTIEEERQIYDELGIVFLYARTHHPAMRHVATARANYGKPTIFNLLGPLCNPARVRKQLVGISNLYPAQAYAKALSLLDVQGLVVHAASGLDEITVTGGTTIVDSATGKQKILRPEDFSLPRYRESAMRGGSGEKNREIAQELVSGRGPALERDLVIFNAGAALELAGLAKNLSEGILLARETLFSGAVQKLIQAYVRASQRQASFLERILEKKKGEIRSLRRSRIPLSPKRNFICALRRRTPALIAEIKPKSPAHGQLLRPDQVEEVISLYSQHADAISVLCDKTIFGGSYDLLSRVRTKTSRPLLAKEFILDTKQIDAADATGADAVLLIASILTKRDLSGLARYAASRGLSLLLEVHSAEDIEKIPDLEPEQLAIGINNRDLKTLMIDLQTFSLLAPLVRKKFPHHLLIAESGYESGKEIRAARLANGFLIGTGLLRNKTRSDVLQAFPHTPCIKICGITRMEDARLCEKLNVEYVGLNFIRSSPRCITLAEARKLCGAFKKTIPVGIFLESQGKEIQKITRALKLTHTQIYRESTSAIELPRTVTVIHAFREIPSLLRLKGLTKEKDFILLDGKENGQKAHLEGISSLPEELRSRLFLAGGLTPQNVKEIAQKIRPLVIVSASGVERSPGIKDPTLIEHFIRSVRSS